MKNLVLDLGSHSVKAYLRDQTIEQVANITWNVLGDPGAMDRLRGMLDQLTRPHQLPSEAIQAIGTEAMRRNPELERQVRDTCSTLGITYRTLSQNEEAVLIRQAVASDTAIDIVNAGGGSIQIVLASDEIRLLPFGIVDLNRRFDLASAPSKRRTDECIQWVAERLPFELSEFIYTGGEETYLRKLGAPLSPGRCQAADFYRLASTLEKLPLETLESLSPHDPKWMNGAIASNCIVIACLHVSGMEHFIPSDVNIAHGLVSHA